LRGVDCGGWSSVVCGAEAAEGAGRVGSAESENLWAVCGECWQRKSDLLASLSRQGRNASVHIRIGETLIAVGFGRPTPSWLLEIVGGQSNWRARLRELRKSGWEIEARRRRADNFGRTRVDYILWKLGIQQRHAGVPDWNNTGFTEVQVSR